MNNNLQILEIIDIIQKEANKSNEEEKSMLENCITFLNECAKTERVLEESIKKLVEDAINKTQKRDILSQQKLFESWINTREVKLKEQKQRLDRAQRIEQLEEKQRELKLEEQKLWFFENEEQIELEIESKEKFNTKVEKTKKNMSDENYIPPEILPKRR
ncbi:unnamed protein product, partial [Iphiclides podalirius]